MKTYLVGGIVRDMIMNQMLGYNIESKDRDWVVIGSTPEEIMSKGFKKVGEFPVFLHPETHEEYALARSEKKTGKGYKGFSVTFSPSVTLEEDLKRRDLTINAIAKDPVTDKIFDPYGGVNDIQNKILRHVSPAFVEDPLRVLRVARFAARFADFTIAEETQLKMRQIVDAGEMDSLTPERVWQEIRQACSENKPSRFIDVLRKCGALRIILPEVNALFGISQPATIYPEGCVGLHTLITMDQVAKQGEAIEVWAALLHDIGQSMTHPVILPNHYGYEECRAKIAKEICNRLKVPRQYSDLSILVAKYHPKVHQVMKISSRCVLKLLEAVGAFRNQEQFDAFLKVCEAGNQSRTGFRNNGYRQADFIRHAYQVCVPVQGKMFVEQGYQAGANIGELITQERIHRIDSINANKTICSSS